MNVFQILRGKWDYAWCNLVLSENAFIPYVMLADVISQLSRTFQANSDIDVFFSSEKTLLWKGQL